MTKETPDALTPARPGPITLSDRTAEPVWGAASA
jgi:hypothetical protein